MSLAFLDDAQGAISPREDALHGLRIDEALLALG